MLRLLLLLLLAPFSVLTRPTPSSAGQLVLQFSGSPVIEYEAPPAPSSVFQLVYEFPPDQGIRLENLAARPNGHLVLTAVSKPFVYDLDPKPHHITPKLLYKFPGVTSMLGIVETAPDIFAVIGGNWSTTTFLAEPGTFSVWSMDLNTPEPKVKLISSIPGGAALNGIATLAGSPDIVLIADSTLGAVWRLNIVTGDHSIAIQNPLFTNCSATSLIAINGIRTFEGMLYFLNSAQGSYGRVPITNDGSATGEVEILGRVDVPAAIYDDFAMDWEGNAWAATHPNAVSQVTVEGRHRNVTGEIDNVEMTQPTSAEFGRGSKQEEKILYMTTTGSRTVGGQVIAVNTCMI